tara:strand:+ start:20299 stop:21507 length:1209 start_codon:yes stop_codon:yes gene_type:complete
MSETITKVSLLNYGITPCSEWVEARKAGLGFEVWHWHEYALRDPAIRFQIDTPYSWRQLAALLPDIFGEDGFNVEPEAARLVEVEGEDGLAAETLRYAFASGESLLPDFAKLIIDQTDETIALLEGQLGGHLDDDAIEALNEIYCYIHEQNLPTDLEELCRTFNRLEGIDIFDLKEQLERSTVESDRRAREERLRRLAPYTDIIEKMTEPDADIRAVGGPSRRQRMRNFIETFVLENDDLPAGRMRVRSEPGTSYAFDFGVIDFDERRLYAEQALATRIQKAQPEDQIATIDHIPFAELVQERRAAERRGETPQEVDRYFSRKYRLADNLIIRRTATFELDADKRQTGNLTYRSLIWQECLKDGITVAEARKLIASGDYNRPSEEGDIVIAAYRGAIRLQIE